MRWLVAILVLAAAVSVEAQEEKGAKLLRDFEKKLKAAKAYRVTFDVKFEAAKRPSSLKGNLLVAGNKLKGAAKGKDGDRPVDMTFLSDGKKQETTTIIMRKPLRSRWETSPKLGATVTGLLARMGVFHLLAQDGGALVAEKAEALPDQLGIKGIKLTGTEKLGDKEAQVVAYALEFKSDDSPAPQIACKVWFDPATNLPLKRTLEISIKGKVFISGVETFSRWEIDPEIKEGTFTLQK